MNERTDIYFSNMFVYIFGYSARSGNLKYSACYITFRKRYSQKIQGFCQF